MHLISSYSIPPELTLALYVVCTPKSILNLELGDAHVLKHFWRDDVHHFSSQLRDVSVRQSLCVVQEKSLL